MKSFKDNSTRMEIREDESQSIEISVAFTTESENKLRDAQHRYPPRGKRA